MKLIEYNSLYGYLGDNIEKKVQNIMYYIEFIDNRYVAKFGKVDVLFDKDDLALLHSYYNSQDKLDYVEINDSDELIIMQSLKTVCAYCFVNNRLNDYDKLASNILDNIQGFLDRVRVYGGFINDGQLDTYNLITFVLNYLETHKVLVK